MVKTQEIIRRRTRELSTILLMAGLGGYVFAGPTTPDPFGGFGDLGGQKAATVIRQGTAELDKNDKEKEALLKRQAQLQTPDPAISQQLGRIERKNTEIAETRGYGLQHFPTDSYVLSAIADQTMRSDLKKAQTLADQAVAFAGNDKMRVIDAYNTHGLIAEKMADFPAAAADAKKVLSVDPTNKTAQALWYANKDRAKAGITPATPAMSPAPTFTRTTAQPVPIALTPTAPNIKSYLDRAATLIGMRDYRGAIDAAQRAAALDPSNPDPHMLQAAGWAALRNMSEAMLAISRAIEKLAEGDARLPAAYNTRALYKNKIGDYVGAVADAGAAIKRDPVMADAYYQRSAAEKALGQNAESLADIKRAAELKPSDYKNLYDMAARELGENGGAAAAARSESGLHRIWSGMINAAGGVLPLIVGSAGAILILFAGYVMLFSKDGSPSNRIKRWFTPAPDDQPRVIGGHIQILREIDRGGMGVVFEAFDQNLKRPVAVKRLSPELQDRERERRRILEEARTLAIFHHPNILEVHEVITEGEDIFIVCPLLDGHTVHAEIGGKSMEPRRVLEITEAVAQAIDYSHGKGVIHRDLKPSNIMVTKDGRVLVMDYGISKSNVNHSRMTKTDLIVGTPAYMAPEQEMGAVSRQSDVWALAVTVYEMLSGRLPFATNDLSRKLEKRPGRFDALTGLKPSLPTALDAVFEKALDADPARRQKTCLDFHRDLEAAIRLPTPRP